MFFIANVKERGSMYNVKIAMRNSVEHVLYFFITKFFLYVIIKGKNIKDNKNTADECDRRKVEPYGTAKQNGKTVCLCLGN